MRGKPLLKNWNISMSDTRGYVAICLSKTRRVGVDIEYLSNRVSKIAERFIRTDEQARDVREQLLHWCTKETVYKYYSEQNLDYFEMRLKAFEMAAQGSVAVENLKNQETLLVSYLFMDEALLTYSVG
jgi:phosphopantetheinyl transferase